MKKKPNVLLITSDQQHWMTLGYNNPEIKTPNLDRLAESGMAFNRAYCPNPTCTPSRASIITGLYPSQHGGYSLGTKVPEGVHTVGDDFHQNGYRCALIGKAHFQQLYDHPMYRSIESNPLQGNLDFWRDFHGPFYGFDHVELARNHTDEFHAGQHYGIWLERKGLSNWRDYFQEKPGGERQYLKWNLPEEFHYDAWIAERTNAMLEEYAENGDHFFLWASFPDPHPPYLVPEPWATMYDPEKITVPAMLAEEDFSEMPPHHQKTQEEDPDCSEYLGECGFDCHGLWGTHLHDRTELAKKIAVYYGMISLMDKYIGKVLDKLEELGLHEDTLVVFTSDHGHFYGHHGLVAKGPFHYEDMLRVPFIASLPKNIPANIKTDSLLSLVDLAPTFLSYCGIEVPGHMTGIDQKAVFTGATENVRKDVIVENNHQPDIINVRTYLDKRYKLSVYMNKDYGELFDLESDPHETRNLWNAPESRELKSELLLKYIHAEMAKESLHMPRVANA